MKKTRWQQRLENFTSAFTLLSGVFDEKSIAALSDLEKEGVIQRFEYTFELAWKTLKDYLEYTGIELEQLTPRSVIKQAFAAKIITEGQVWIDMLDRRNLLSHTYQKKLLEEGIHSIVQDYLPAIKQVFLFLCVEDKKQ